MGNFTADAARALGGAAWLSERRTAAAERFAAGALPTPAEEAWRYSRIDQLDLDRYRPLAPGAAGPGTFLPPRSSGPPPCASSTARWPASTSTRPTPPRVWWWPTSPRWPSRPPPSAAPSTAAPTPSP